MWPFSNSNDDANKVLPFHALGWRVCQACNAYVTESDWVNHMISLHKSKKVPSIILDQYGRRVKVKKEQVPINDDTHWYSFAGNMLNHRLVKWDMTGSMIIKILMTLAVIILLIAFGAAPYIGACGKWLAQELMRLFKNFNLGWIELKDSINEAGSILSNRTDTDNSSSMTYQTFYGLAQSEVETFTKSLKRMHENHFSKNLICNNFEDCFKQPAPSKQLQAYDKKDVDYKMLFTKLNGKLKFCQEGLNYLVEAQTELPFDMQDRYSNYLATCKLFDL